MRRCPTRSVIFCVVWGMFVLLAVYALFSGYGMRASKNQEAYVAPACGEDVSHLVQPVLGLPPGVSLLRNSAGRYTFKYMRRFTYRLYSFEEAVAQAQVTWWHSQSPGQWRRVESGVQEMGIVTPEGIPEGYHILYRWPAHYTFEHPAVFLLTYGSAEEAAAAAKRVVESEDCDMWTPVED